ncbi:ABC-three component system protein [Pseudomonas coleopterorum]|uniref:SMEK domain-containing protein n=1 Tax=Pseudomonas coleopterorum TaxID=1605838 RepID=A0ABR9BV22_9PSED|nr:ABC-three component system protein [Pseudomonas coleopterorum]MBD8757054.1 SMEK domain-containing protein [Pseudomonas coleopterorum]MBD8768705.1 SMEK domain-containing protein [Pseudomonas coleopterorum]
MNRSIYFNLCEERLSILCTRVELRGKLNILDFHLHSEDFYVSFLNLLFGYALKNINASAQNVEGIDLVDVAGKLVLQVSSTATKFKIESALGKDLSAYRGHNFKFLSISKDAKHLRGGVYANPHGLIFLPEYDVYDVSSILNKILHLDIAKQQKIYDFLKSELKADIERPLTETNLASIINIISEDDLFAAESSASIDAYSLDEKIGVNKLVVGAQIIEDYKIYHPRIEQVYGLFDAAGRNKSKSVLDSLRYTYLQLSVEYGGDVLFFKIIEAVVEKVRTSANYVTMPLDELERNVKILAVDAFIRCKVLQEPKGVKNVAT